MPAGGLVTAGLVGGVGAGVLGNVLSQGDRDKAEAAKQAALQQWLSINVPDPAQQAVALKHYQSTGHLSPQLEQAFQQSQTGLKGMAVDPTSRAAEVQALQQMQNVSSAGGMDAQSRQKEAEALNSSNANERGQRGAIIQDFASRGIGGSGPQLAAMLQAQQGDSNQAAANGLSSASGAEQRALQAMTSSGQMAGQLNSQDYGQAAAAAKAQDEINRFNTQNAQGVQQRNIESQNKAQAGNLASDQNISNQNVGVDNQEEMHNKGLYQQEFDNYGKKAAGAGGAYGGVAAQDNANADSTANMWGGISDSLAQGAGAYGQYAQKKPKDQSGGGYSEEVV